MAINKICQRLISGFFSISSLFISSAAFADGLSIDKVYHPYVQPLERELEFRWLYFDQNANANASGNNQIYRLGYGQSVSDSWFLEAYIIGDNNNNESRINAYEFEAKWQLTEQGQYAADWGLLFEYERGRDRGIRELSTTLMAEREWGRTVGTGNVSMAFESGADIDNELEMSAAFQLRYRYSRALEPAIELYSAQDTLALGPAIMGEQRFGVRKKLHWELGLIAGLSNETPDTTLRALAEFEF